MDAAEAVARVSGIPPVETLDEYNREWTAHAHPTDWTNPAPAERYNLLVIGAGPAGLVAAAGAAGLGAKVALVEKHLMGGDCLNFGCVPSKALLRCAKACADVRDAGAFGVQVPLGMRVDFAKIMGRMRKLRADISHHDAASRFRDLGIDVFLGAGSFTGRDRFEIGGSVIRFAKACIATGARAAAPSIPGLEDVAYLTNETLFSLTELPSRLGVIGAGPIGCEMAQAFARFGSEVVLLKGHDRVLPREDPDAAELVEQALERDGVRLLGGGKEARVVKSPDGIRLTLSSHTNAFECVVDRLLVSVGRIPNVENLGLEAAGVEHDKTGVKVNDRLQTSNPNIYAAGDISSAYKFTHAADALARIVIRNALFFGRVKASALIIPWCTYTDPELAHVGLSEAEAQTKGIPIDTHKRSFEEVDRAILDGETEGFVKIHVRKGTDRIVGATIIARHAGEMINEITLAMTQDIGLGRLAGVIHPYPTQAEAIRQAGDLYNRTQLTPGVKKLFTLLMGWRR